MGRACLYTGSLQARLAGVKPTPVQFRLAAILAAVLVLGWLLYSSQQRDPQSAAQALFLRLQDEIKDHDAAGVIQELHPRYDIAQEWGGEISEEGADAQANLRTQAKRGLALLMMQQGDGMRLDFALSHLQVQGDGTVAVDASLGVGSGGARLMVSPQPAHHFVLAWSGIFWPRLKVLQHDPITVSH